MATHLHPQHILLGITPESPAKGRAKVIACLIGLSLTTAVMLAQDFHLIRDQFRPILSSLKSKHRPCKASRTTKIRFE